MFYILHTTWQLILTALGLLIFAGVAWRWPRRGAWLVIFLAPLYWLKIASWPLTILESLIWVFAGVWGAKKIKNKLLSFLSYGKEGKKSWIPACAGMTKERLAMVVKNDLFWPILLILIGVVLSTIFSVDWRAGAGILKAWFIAPLIFAFVFNNILDSGERAKLILSALAASAASAALIALGYLFYGRLTYDGRLAAFYLSPNHLAMWLAPGLIAGFGLFFYVKNNWQRILLFIVYCLLLIVLYFTYSYGAWLGLIAATIFILFYLWYLKLISKRFLLYVTCYMLIGLATLTFLQLGNANGKLIDLLTSPRSSWQSRLLVWQAAIKILQDHWLIGIGQGMFQNYYLAYQKFFPPYLEWAMPQPHNLFLAWWLQAGLTGFIGFLWLVVNFFRWAMVSVKNHLIPTLSSFEERGEKIPPPAGTPFTKGEKNPSFVQGTTEGRPPLEIFLTAVMVYFLVHGLVDTTFWKNDLALIFWVIAVSATRASRRVC